MYSPENKPLLVVIVGPTGVGKTEISISLAEHFGGEIISADSRLFYKGMDIGTAKPSAAEREKIRHHLIDVAKPDETWSLALFQKAAREAIQSIQKKGNLPFLVGGTGQYIRAVTEEWGIPPQEPDHRIRAVLEKWADEIGTEGLHARLAILDPAAAARIDHRNLRRTIRALEVTLKTGVRYSDQRRKLGSPYDLLTLGLIRRRADLYVRIDKRIESMISNGFVGEVEGLLAKGFAPDLPSFSAIGYKEIIQYLKKEITLDEAVVKIKKGTRQFVRRQANWFKENDPGIKWFLVNNETIEQLEQVINDRIHHQLK
jgi:tRNA dimethylallyltransferase